MHNTNNKLDMFVCVCMCICNKYKIAKFSWIFMNTNIDCVFQKNLFWTNLKVGILQTAFSSHIKYSYKWIMTINSLEMKYSQTTLKSKKKNQN